VGVLAERLTDPAKSIVNAEFRAARELNVPVFTFVRRDVLDDHRLYQRNKANAILDQIEFPSLDKQDFAKLIFQFIDDVRLSKTNNGFFPFEYSRDIESLLKKQWAAMMFDFLQRRHLADQYENQNKLLSSLTATTGQLEDLVKRLYRRADVSHGESVIENVELRAKAEQFFRDLFRHFDLPGFSRTPLDTLVNLPTDTTWYEWLDSTDDFYILPALSEEGTGRHVDVLCHEATNTVFYVRSSELKPIERKWVTEYEDRFGAFRRLEEKDKRDVIAPFVVPSATGTGPGDA
jgi:hypothetical protein